jgi:hypothetical protein
MATGQMSEVVQHLRRALLWRQGAGRTDGQLLAPARVPTSGMSSTIKAASVLAAG